MIIHLKWLRLKIFSFYKCFLLFYCILNYKYKVGQESLLFEKRQMLCMLLYNQLDNNINNIIISRR